MDDEKRAECVQAVVEDLRKNETLTGYTSLTDYYGLRQEEVRETADAAGYDWSGISGSGQGGRVARLQRRLPGQESPSEVVDASADPVAAFLARLDNAETGLDGKASIEITDVPRMRPEEWQALASSRGWKPLDIDGDRYPHRVYRYFARVGTTPVDGTGNEFIHGPPLTELRKHDAAVQMARWCQRKFGVDPLSDAELDQTRATHERLNKQTKRFGCLFALPFLCCLVLVLGALGAGESQVLVLAGVIAVPALIGLVLMIRSTKRLKRATKRYRDAYTKVAAAAFGKDAPK